MCYIYRIQNIPGWIPLQICPDILIHKLFTLFNRYADTFEDRDRKKIIDLERPFYIAEKNGVLTGKIDLIQEKGF